MTIILLTDLFKHLLSSKVYLNEKITIFNEKFPNQFKELTNSNVSSNILPLYKTPS